MSSRVLLYGIFHVLCDLFRYSQSVCAKRKEEKRLQSLRMIRPAFRRGSIHANASAAVMNNSSQHKGGLERRVLVSSAFGLTVKKV